MQTMSGNMNTKLKSTKGDLWKSMLGIIHANHRDCYLLVIFKEVGDRLCTFSMLNRSVLWAVSCQHGRSATLPSLPFQWSSLSRLHRAMTIPVLVQSSISGQFCLVQRQIIPLQKTAFRNSPSDFTTRRISLNINENLQCPFFCFLLTH